MTEPKLEVIGFEGAKLSAAELFEWLVRCGFVDAEEKPFVLGLLPHNTFLKGEQIPASWVRTVDWKHARFRSGLRVSARRPGVFTAGGMTADHPSPQALLGELESLEFSYGCIGPVWDWKSLPGYERGPGLPVELGFGAFFQGEGHRALVSRRWLDHGPWRVLRGDNDTTLVQFHDLDAPAEEAWRQARAGHLCLMARASKPRGHVPRSSLAKGRAQQLLAAARAMYVQADRTLRIVVQGREVPYDEMLYACHAREYGLPDAGPIDAVRYIFLEERAARAHLPDLWLRELECWTFDSQGEEIRIDEDFYLEPPPKPEWVLKLERSAG